MLYKISILLFVYITIGTAACNQINLIGPIPGNSKSLTPAVTTENKNPIKRNRAQTPMIVAEKKAAANATVKIAKKEEPKASTQQCENQSYGKALKRAKRSLKKGLAALKADRFGVGFRNQAEYEKWQQAHDVIFSKATKTCKKLKSCKNKSGESKCKTLKRRYQMWTNSAKEFAKKAKTVEYTQPEILCPIKPTLDDPSRCFEKRGNNVAKICRTAKCKKLSSCWRDLASTDEGVKQAESSCRYLYTDLNQCNAYVVITDRRKQIFANCSKQDQEYKLNIRPVL